MNKARTQLKKPLALLLALIMLFSMMTTAFAEVASNNGGQPPKYTPSGTEMGWSINYDDRSPFSRYTLAYFPNGVKDNNWETGYIISYMDISPKSYGVDISSFHTNALWYRQGRVDIGHSWYDNWQTPKDRGPGMSDTAVRSERSVFGDTLPYGASTDFRTFAEYAETAGLSSDGMLRYMFTGNEEGSVQKTYNNAFSRLIVALGQKAISEGWDNDQIQRLVGDGADEFIADDNYRLFVEPGVVVKNQIAGTYFAMTLRDMAAYSEYMEETDSSKVGTLLYHMSNVAAADMGLTLYETKDAFTVVEGGDTVSKSHAFSAAKTDDLKLQTDGKPILKFKHLRNILFGKGTSGYAGASWGVGEYAAYGLGIVLPKLPGEGTSLTVTKKVEGEGASKDTPFGFEVELTDLPEGVTPTSTNADFNWTAPVASFYLKDGESCTINIDGVTEENDVSYTITEPSAATMGYTTTFSATDGGTTGTGSFTYDNNTAVTVTNTKNEVADGVAHLIIDYNLNGTIATTGSGATDTVDCGAIPYSSTDPSKNVVNDITPMIDGTALYKGYTMTQTVGSVTVTMTYKGLFDAPKGGNEVNGSYQLQHDGLTVLYAQWDITTSGGTTTTTPDPTEGDLYTIFWDYNYYGAAVTSSLAGSFKIHKTIACSTNPVSGVHHLNYSDYEEITVTLPFSYPDSQAVGTARHDGWVFLGWSTQRYMDTGLHGSAADALKDKGSTTGNPKDPTFKPKAPSKSLTFYAIWRAHDITWNANGGYFDMTQAPTWPENSSWVYSSDKTTCIWEGWVNGDNGPTDVIPIIKRTPVREGYVFDAWYYDSLGNVPITETETGLMPGRTYYAGWTPQPVKVNYYDNRQGTTLISTQTYNYNDLFSLLADPTDTDGSLFTGWKVATVNNGKITATTETAASSGTHLTKGVMGMAFHDTETKPVEDKDGGYWEINLVASWNENTIDYTTNIVWDDAANNDGLRPQSVHVGLVSSVGNQLVAEEWVTGSSTAPEWTVTFESLPVTTVDASVEKITYSTSLLGYTDSNGRTKTIYDTGATKARVLADLSDQSDKLPTADNWDNDVTPFYEYQINNISMPNATNNHWVNQYNGTIFFSHSLVQINFPFSIYWDDAYNNDGFRPSYVALNLYREDQNGTRTLMHTSPYHADASFADVEDYGRTWGYYFPNLNKFRDQGKEVMYYAQVQNMSQVNERVPNGSDTYHLKYVGAESNMSHNGVTFSRTLDRATYTGKIRWDDESNRDGLRPSGVSVNLVARKWNQFRNTWETSIEDTTFVTGDMASNEWTFSFADQLVYSGGYPVIYTYEVGNDLNFGLGDDVNHYDWADIGNDTLRIGYVINQTSVRAAVIWDDGDNNDAWRPEKIRVRLYADGTPMSDYYTVDVEGGESNVWECSFSGLPKYRAGKVGQTILYTIGVEEVDKDELYGTFISMANGEQEKIKKYVAIYSNDGENVFDPTESTMPVATLKHDLQTYTINTYVSWHDDNNHDGKRPESLTIDFWKEVNGKTTLLDTMTVSAGEDNSWRYKRAGLPQYENGSEVRYYVDLSDDFRAELLSTYKYTASVQDNILHLYYKAEKGDVTAIVSWEDNNNNDGLRPSHLYATLYVNGEKSTQPMLALNAENNWTATWTDLSTYFSDQNGVGQAVKYSVVVDTEDTDYTATYTPETVTVLDGTPIYVTVAHEGNTKTVSGSIFWNDNANSDAVRPEAVTVQLYANGRPVSGKTAVVSGEGDTWTFSFENVPAMQNGKAIVYTVALADNTGKTYDVVAAGMNLYLAVDPKTNSLTVNFSFDDRNNADGKRPTGLYLYLTQDGERVESSRATVYFDDLEDGKRYVFESLPIYSTAGQNINYGIEVELDADLFGGNGYTASTTRNVQLSQTGKAALTVKLTHNPDTATKTGRVYWFDNDNQRGNRPSELSVFIHNNYTSNIVGPYTMNANTMSITDANGMEVGQITSITEWGDIDDSRWDYEIYDLPKNTVYEDGTAAPITYWAVANLSGLSNWYSKLDGKDTGMDITMTHVNYAEDRPNSTQSYDVSVVWADNSNAWAYRPDAAGVDVTMLANGQPTNYKAHLDKNNATEAAPDTWSYHFDNLPTYLNGHAVVWTASISDQVKYTASETPFGTYSVIKMTQTGAYDLTVRWADTQDNDGMRPESVSVSVLADGKEVVGSPVVLTGEGDTWTARIEDLPVWRENGAGAAVAYSFRWEAETATVLHGVYAAKATVNGNEVDSDTFYYVSTSGWGDTEDTSLREFSATWETTLAHDKETMETDFYASVTFEDDANRDGLRPEVVYVTLLANGQPQDEPVAVTGDMNAATWSVSWSGLYVYEGGKPVVYTVALVDPDSFDGYTASIDESNTQITLAHDPATVSVTAAVRWDDTSEMHRKGDSLTEFYFGIPRVDTYVQLYANGEPVDGAVRKIQAANYPEGANTATWTWNSTTARPLYEKENGEEVVYTFVVFSSDLDELLNDGYGLVYDNSQKYAPVATISHDLYDVRGTVYYLRNTSKEFLLADVPVTAYLYNEATSTYSAVGNTRTDANGNFELLNLPQGLLTIRATYTYMNHEYAGSVPVHLDRMDNTATVIVNRDSTIDSDLYLYTATGNAYYQTNVLDDGTIAPVPAGSIVLLYQLSNETGKAEYLAMTTTDDNGGYRFADLAQGKYLVNVVFNHNDGTYTFDDEDGKGLAFVVAGADIKWPDIIKQVNANVAIGPDVDPEPDEPTPAPAGPQPCVVSGNVYYSDNGVHTTDAIEGVDVYLYTATNVKLAQTSTDANGQWSVEGIAAGDYIAVFSYRGAASRVLVFTVSDDDYDEGTYEVATQYFDRYTDATATIRGVVLADDGSAKNAMVEVTDNKGDVVDFAYVDKNGLYQFTVPANKTYGVKITEVGKEQRVLTAGVPGTELTTLDYYTLSGNFSINSQAQEGQTIAIYKQLPDLSFKLATATMTNGKGDYTVKVAEAGNYKVVAYLGETVYDEHNITVGLDGEVPAVAEANGTYTISGNDAFETLTLYVVDQQGIGRVVKTMRSSTGYKLAGLEAGVYDLALTKNGEEVHYYVDCPDNVISRSYRVTVSGSVLDNAGKPILGATVNVYDSYNVPVGRETVITNGTYSYSGLEKGIYTVAINCPTTGNTLCNKTTMDPDFYGNAYPNGISGGATWAWNINAVRVSGMVVDQNGRPMPGATVVLKSDNNPDLAYGSTTNENGEWSMGVAPGNYTADAMMEIDEAHIYHANASVPVVAAKQAVDGVTMTIAKYTMTGSVVKAGDNTSIPNASITIAYEDGTIVWQGQADNEGSFVVPVFADTYVITATLGDLTNSVTVSVNKDTAINVALDSPVVLSGVVYNAQGNIVPDAIVSYTNLTSGKTGYAYTNNEGRYSITLYAAELGEYQLVAESMGVESDAKTVTVKGDTVQDLTLANIDTNAPTYILSGTVVDNKGNRLENAIVTATYGNDKEKVIRTSTNRNGEYRFAVVDGTYYLTATYQGHETNSETVAHVNGADVEKTLPIIMFHPAYIFVTDTDGKPVSDATVTYVGATTDSVQTDEDGRAFVELPGGDYEFTATMGNRSDTAEKTVAGKTTVALTLALPGLADNEPTVQPGEDKAIWGTVVDANGKPVKDATVTLNRYDFDKETWVVVDAQNSASDGSYYFGGLAEGRYEVDIQYVVTDTVSGTPASFEVSGIAADNNGNPYINAAVDLIDEDGNVNGTITTGSDGSYTFTNVPEGFYTVNITPANGRDIYVIDVDTVPTSVVVEGVAVDATGTPIPNATVTVADQNGVEWVGETDKDGAYYFEFVGQGDGEYTVTIVYPKTVLVETAAYEPDKNDPNAPGLGPDTFIIKGIVYDTDDNALSGVTVKLLDTDRTTTTDENGEYVFEGVPAGEYTVVVTWGASTKEYTVVTPDQDSGATRPNRPDLTDTSVKLSGVVVTDHKTPLANAKVIIKNLDTDETFTVRTDKDGRFSQKGLPLGRYELQASYTHIYGTNNSDALTVTNSKNDVVLVVVLSYTTDVNGDSKAETVYAGPDDEFDTTDDYYPAEVGNGDPVDVLAGADKSTGTEDDHYTYPVDNEPKDVFVGDDRIPGTEDDWYTGMVDDTDVTVWVGKDGTPGTEDDWYNKDVDVDGKDEQVFVGPDGKPGTDDDWYLDGNGDKQLLAIWVRFNANGGTVEGLTELAVKAADLQKLPVAIFTGKRFNGWSLKTADGTTLSLEDIQKFVKSTVVYAQWTVNTSGGGSGSSGGGSSVGGGSHTEVIGDNDTPLANLGNYHVKDLLNTNDHIAYIAGMPDGNVYPMNNITRAEVAMIFYRLLNDDVRNLYKTKDNSFTDVDPDAWYATAVSTLARMGILRGKGDNVFDPDAKITRAEFAVIAARFDQLETGTVSFPDVASDHWAYKEIVSAATKGWVKGYDNGNFGPSDNITRAEVMTLVNRMLGRDQLTVDGLLDSMTVWPDNMDTSAWYYLAVQEATNGHNFKQQNSVETWAELTVSPVGNE